MTDKCALVRALKMLYNLSSYNHESCLITSNIQLMYLFLEEGKYLLYIILSLFSFIESTSDNQFLNFFLCVYDGCCEKNEIFSDRKIKNSTQIEIREG